MVSDDHSERLKLVERNIDVVSERLEGALSKISDAVHEISIFVQQLVSLQERHELRYGETKSGLERAFSENKELADRVRDIEIHSAGMTPETKATTEWVRLIIVLILGAAIGYLFNK